MNDIQNGGDSFVTATERPVSFDAESSEIVSSDSLRRVKRRKRSRSIEPEAELTGTTTQERPSKCGHFELDFERPSESPPGTASLKDEAGPSPVADEANTSQSKESLNGDHQSINKSVEIIMEEKETNINGDVLEDADEVGDYSTLLNSDSESDGDGGLPTVSFCKGDWSFSDVKENTIIWVKYGKYPFWPALVESVNKRNKKLKVYFLGWPDRHSIPMSYRDKKKFAPYNYENTVKYKAHSFNDLKDQVTIEYFKKWFDLALREAETLYQLRIDNKVRGPPRYQYEMIVEKRPSSFSLDESKPPQYSFSNTDNDNDGEESLNNNDKEGEESDTNYDLSDNEDDQPGDTSSPYCFSKLMEHFEKNESFIEEVCLGKESSELHQSYSGTKSDRKKIRTLTEFGPAKLTKSQKLRLYEFIEKIMKRAVGSASFTYIYDVLIPEVMVRTIASIENCSLPDAWRKLETS